MSAITRSPKIGILVGKMVSTKKNNKAIKTPRTINEENHQLFVKNIFGMRSNYSQ